MSATTVVSATAVYVFGPVRIQANGDVTVNPLSVSREERFKQMGFELTNKKNLDISGKKKNRHFLSKYPSSASFSSKKIVIFIKIYKKFVRYSGDSANSK